MAEFRSDELGVAAADEPGQGGVVHGEPGELVLALGPHDRLVARVREREVEGLELDLDTRSPELAGGSS